MARYRARAALFVRRLIDAGEEFESDLPPGRNWEPIDDAAKAAVEEYMASRGKVLALYDRLDPKPRDKAAVDIPPDWATLSGPKRRSLAQRLGAQSNVTEADANSFINAELEIRGKKRA
jgi:hypothetical protein